MNADRSTNTEAELRAREDELRRIVDHLPAIVSYLDRECRFIRLNRMYEWMFGRSAEWAIGRHLSEVAGEPHYSRAKPKFERALKGELVQFESQVRRHDGQLRDISVTYTPRIEDGAVVGVTAMVQDITERRRAETALRESEERLRLATSAARMRTWELDLEQANADYEALFGVIDDEDRARWWQSLMEAIRNRSTFHCEYRVRRGDGALRWITAYGKVAYDAGNNPVRMVGVTRDTTERREGEEALRHTAERLSFALEAAHMADWSWDASTGIVTLSDSGCEMFGLAPGSSTSWTGMEELICRDDFGPVLGEFERCVTQGEDFSCEFRVRAAGGTWRWILGRGRVVRGARGAVSGMLGVLQDTTARRESEEALRRTNEDLRRANEDLAQFAYSASHDLREPLRIISAYSQLLRRRYEGALDEQADKFIGFTVQGAQRMEALIRDLLAYSQATALADQAEAPEVDASAVLTRVLSSLQAVMESNGATVTADLLPSLPVHEVHLEQLLQNLIENGLKYRGDEPPVIRITVRRSGSEWLFAISDNGIGIDPQYTAQIFGIFRRLHNAEQYPGTGIGLAICQKIVQRYGGRSGRSQTVRARARRSGLLLQRTACRFRESPLSTMSVPKADTPVDRSNSTHS